MIRHLFCFLAFCTLSTSAVGRTAFAQGAWQYSSAPCERRHESLRLSFLFVGQGDATLIRCPYGQGHMLIDGGPSDQDYPGAEQLFETALRQRLGAEQRIDLLLLSHPHPDHSFGLRTLLETMDIGVARYIDNGADNPESEIEEGIRRLLDKKGIDYRRLEATAFAEERLCPSNVKLRLIQPRGAAARELGCPKNFNDCSIVTTLSYGGMNVALMADATRNWERRALASDVSVLPRPLHLMKVGHHGAGAPSKEFIEWSTPALAVISAGKPTLGTTKLRGYPKRDSLEVLEQNAREQPGAAKLPQYSLAACTFEDGACRWTNTVVPTTLLATASLGSLDVYLQPGHLCAMGEHLKGSIHFTFPNETLASDLE